MFPLFVVKLECIVRRRGEGMLLHKVCVFQLAISVCSLSCDLLFMNVPVNVEREIQL